jgi:Uri superfamily endonuclease
MYPKRKPTPEQIGDHSLGLQLAQSETMPDFHDLPTVGGVYTLHFFLARSRVLVSGRLGQHHLPAGHYFYVGSARGAGGLRSRVGRHIRGDGQPHWHIDTLRAVAEIRNVFYTAMDTPLECTWGQALAQLPQAFIPIPHFGAGDCRSDCRAHLIAFPRHVDMASVLPALAKITPTPIESLHSLVR